MISVCIATYNGEKYLKEQIDSILPQLKEEDEVIVSDDGSKDSTLEILKRYNDSRIKIFYNNKKRGVIGNFENALSHAMGDYIFLSDQDDVWLPNKVEVVLNKLQSTDLIFSNAKIVNDNLEETGLLYNDNSNCGLFRNLIKNRYIGATMAFRASLLKIALPFPVKIPMHDQWIGLLAECCGSTNFIPNPLILYRRHDFNASSTGSSSKYGMKDKLKFRINISKSLFTTYISNRFHKI